MEVARRRQQGPDEGRHDSTNTSRPASPTEGHDDIQVWSLTSTDDGASDLNMKTIAILQFAPELGQVDKNIAHANELLDAANIPDALDWLILPELALSGKPCSFFP